MNNLENEDPLNPQFIQRYEKEITNLCMFGIPLTKLNKKELMACICHLKEIVKDAK